LQWAEQDYISLTDMASAKEGDSRSADIIKNWIRNRYTIEFLGTWEVIHNPNFKVVEFDHFKMQAGLPGFVLSVSDIDLCEIQNCIYDHRKTAFKIPDFIYNKMRSKQEEATHITVGELITRYIN
jgi:hypothetical protein